MSSHEYLEFEIRVRHRELGDMDDRWVAVLVPYEDAQEARCWATGKPFIEGVAAANGFPAADYEVLAYRNAGRRF